MDRLLVTGSLQKANGVSLQDEAVSEAPVSAQDDAGGSRRK